MSALTQPQAPQAAVTVPVVAIANPLRPEPSRLHVALVRTFGLAGLIAVAVGSAVLRWWRS